MTRHLEGLKAGSVKKNFTRLGLRQLVFQKETDDRKEW